MFNKIVAIVLMSALLGACASQNNTKSHNIIAKKHPKRYQVQSGDSISKIADRYGLDWRYLSAINHLDENHTVRVGQWLMLDSSSTVSKY